MSTSQPNPNKPGPTYPGTGPNQPPRPQAPDSPQPQGPIVAPTAPDGEPEPPRKVAPQQMQQSMPSGDVIKGRWQQVIGSAKQAWGKLTEDELLKIEGQEQKLAGLVQERYGITRQAADEQVRTFFAKHLS